MKLRIKDIRCLSIPLVQPYHHNGFTISARDIAIVDIALDDRVVTGELGPFPGINQETLSEALSEVKNTVFEDLPSHRDWQLDQACFGLLGQSFSDSVVAFWEQVFFSDYFAVTKGDVKPIEVDVAGLVILNDEAPQKVEELVQKEFRTIKVKVGRSGIDEEIKILGQLKSLFESYQIKIRLDSNQSLSWPELLAYLDALPPESVQYLEEPKDIDPCEISIAYDEGLWTSPMPEIRSQDFIVVKPQKLPYSRVHHWIKEGLVNPSQVVLSSCFDSSVALRNYMKWAEYWGFDNAHGFGPYRSLDSGKMEKPLASFGGRIKDRL